MIYTFGQALAAIHLLIGKSDQVSLDDIRTLAQVWYVAMRDSSTWSKAREEFTISTVAQIASTSSDTVTVTNGSTAVTSAGTPFASAMEGRQIQIGAEQQYFYIKTFTDTSNVILGDGQGNAVAWPRDTDTSSGWRIFQTQYALPSNASLVLTLNGDRSIEEFDGGRVVLDEESPHRSLTADHADFWLYDGVNSSDLRLITLVDTPAIGRLYRGQVVTEAPTLDDQHVLEVDYASFVIGVAKLATNSGLGYTGDESWQLIHNNLSAEYKRITPAALATDRARTSPVRTFNRRRHARGRRDSTYRALHLR